jgi:hypothetical protein
MRSPLSRRACAARLAYQINTEPAIIAAIAPTVAD